MIESYLDVNPLIPFYVPQDSPEPPTDTQHEGSQSFEQTIARFELQFFGKITSQWTDMKGIINCYLHIYDSFSAMISTLMEKIRELGRDKYNDALINVIYR